MTAIPVLDVSGEASSSDANGGLSSETVALNHAANTLVIAHFTLWPGATLSSITCGGVAMTLALNQGNLYVYTIFRTSAANENVVLTTSNAESLSLVAFSWKNTNQSSPFLEGLTGANGSSVVLPAGTAGRMAMQAIGAYENGATGTWTVTPGSGQTGINTAGSSDQEGDSKDGYTYAGSVVEASYIDDNAAGV